MAITYDPKLARVNVGLHAKKFVGRTVGRAQTNYLLVSQNYAFDNK